MAKMTTVTISETTKQKIMDFRDKYAHEHSILGKSEAAEFLIRMGIKAHESGSGSV